MKWQKQPIFKICFLFVILLVFTSPAESEEKRLTINFDKNNICCIMNAPILTSELEKRDGINSARYNEEARKILVYFDPAKIAVQGIVDEVSKITKVEKHFILPKPDA
jgi:hypothetical protein|tara:strand:+ start:179 stop:502 length:324 start_codon:yes stop_codon:yes gene_type:complete